MNVMIIVEMLLRCSVIHLRTARAEFDVALPFPYMGEVET